MKARQFSGSLADRTAEDDREIELWEAFKRTGSAKTREALFMLYFPFASKLAHRRYFDRTKGDIELADLRQLACAGLLEAIDHYNPHLGVPFRGYASRRISGSILDGIAKMSEVREQISFRNRVRAERTRSLHTANVDDMTGPEAMQALVDLAVGLALGMMLEGTALYTNGEPATTTTAYESLAWKQAVERVMSEVERLPERDQTLVKSHYLQGLNFEQIADLLQISKGRVSQLHKAAMALLKKRLAQAGEFKLER